jgi:multiple sugar transport system substrate-binding protein
MKILMSCALTVALLLLPVAVFAGGGQEPAASGEKVVTVFAGSKAMTDNTWKLRNDAFEKATGIKVDLQLVPGDEEQFYDKTDIAVMGGDTTDCIRLTNPLNTMRYVSAGFLMPLDDMLRKAGYDANAVFGKFLRRHDGRLLYLPYEQSIHAVYYNKKIFKEAGVPYPKAPWTWDDYVATAKRLTSRDKGVYGSYFVLDWEYYFYMTARQRGIPGYKQDGSSNYDDAGFKDALKFMYDLGETYKVQPTFKEYKANKYTWDTWAATGKFGMICIGSWFTGLLTDAVTYPRDWDWGIVETPAAGPKGKNNLMAGGVWGVLKNAKHPQNGARYAAWVSENWYKDGGGIPARVNLTPQEIQGILGGSIAEKSKGSVTVADLDAALMHNTLGVVDEKITGPKAREYTDVINQEAQLYMTGEQSLDDTVRHIKERADKVLISM